MSEVEINVSGANGSGTGIKIYETPNYKYPWQGACVMHGSFTAGPSSPDSQRIEIVQLYIPGVSIRVRAADVAVELRALRMANKTEQPSGTPDKQDASVCAFNLLCSAVFGIAARHLTVEHFEVIARAAFDRGVQQGKVQLQDQICNLLGL